jgi:hypothetical protein
MSFDETRYAQDFIKKLRGARSLPDDLLARYAVTLPLPATDAEIAAQVKAVRTYWNKVSSGSTFTAQAAKMCRADDERLRAQHGAKMETRAWWATRQAERQSAAQASITRLADELRQSHGQLGVVTGGTVDGFAGRLALSRADALQAVKQAGLTLVDGISLPESQPFGGFPALLKAMSQCAVSSVPELVHPGSGPFSLLERYVCTGDPAKRLDVVAVDAQSAEADKRGVSATENARREALKLLRKALKDGIDLRDVALYHMVTIARESVPLSMSMAAAELRKLGLERHDAAVVAVVLHDQSSASSAAGLGKVHSLLSAGRLNEAEQAAQSLPAGSPHRPEAIKEVDAARARLDALLAEVRRAVAVPDEVQAAALLRQAAAISLDDADEALAAVPLAPPAGLRVVCEAATVKLFWQPAPGHDNRTIYVVTRTEQRPPEAASDGSIMQRSPAQSCTDTNVPVVRPLQYGVFALADGRPDSRPAAAPVMLLPPVAQLEAEVGTSDVTMHWWVHPDAQEVRVTRTAEGMAPIPVPVTRTSCRVTGLSEGQAQHFEVTAVYLSPEGAEKRSAAEHVNVTPRSEAKPVPRLKTEPVEVSGAVRVRVAWAPVDKSEVRIVRSDVPPRWPFGARVSHQEMVQFGQEVSGRQVSTGAESAFEAELPPGVHHLVPFSIGGTNIVMGHPAAVGVTDPVRHLVVTPFATHATVSWEWPPTAQLAEVTWAVDNDADCVVIGQAQYRSDGGMRVPLGRGPCTVEVRAVIMVGEETFRSPPVRKVIDSVTDVTVSYIVSATPSIGPFGGRSKRVTFSSDEGCAGTHVQMVALPGRVMPARAEGGLVILDTVLTLPPGIPVEHQVTVPKAVKRPYWVRCFVVGGGGRLIDPPISNLKET